MITVEQVMLKLVELNKLGRQILSKKGVETTEDVTTEEIIQGIEGIQSASELETLIDESGVLYSTEETATEKVEQLINKAKWENIWYEQSGKWTASYSRMFQQSTVKTLPRLNFENATDTSYFLTSNPNIESIDYYINSGKATKLHSMVNSNANLKFIYGVDTSNATTLGYAFAKNPLLETIQEPFNLSKATTLDACFTMSAGLKNISFIVETIPISISFSHSPLLSAESIQSIIDGLATVTTAQKLTLHSNVTAKLTTEQFNTILSKNWELV